MSVQQFNCVTKCRPTFNIATQLNEFKLKKKYIYIYVLREAGGGHAWSSYGLTPRLRTTLSIYWFV